MTGTANSEIRAAAAQYRIHLWQIAKALGIADTTFSRWLREELPSEKKIKILAIIYEIGKLSSQGAGGEHVREPHY